VSIAPVLVAVDVAAALVASGVDATTRVTVDGGVELLVLMDPRLRTMAVLDVCNLATVLVDGPDGLPRTAPGPLAPGVDPCDEVGCLTTAVWVWLLGWRGTHV
jgi:hypothetical protein